MSQMRTVVLFGSLIAGCMFANGALGAFTHGAHGDKDADLWHALENDPGCRYVNSSSKNPTASRWSGACSNGLVQGRGTLTYETDLGSCQIFGTFTDGVIDGYGETDCWTDIDGEAVPYSFKGEFQHGYMTGRAHIRVGDYYMYVGHVVDTLPDGYGTLVQNRTVYSGQFKAGKYDGMGVMVVENTLIFTGTFKDGLASGAGLLELRPPSSLRLTGYFEGSVEQPFDGLEVIGQGVLTNDNGEIYNYFGGFKNLSMHGHGVLVFESGFRYEGLFDHGDRTGPGIAIDPDGNSCEGQWKNGVLEGVGKGLSGGEEKSCTMDASGDFTFFTD